MSLFVEKNMKKELICFLIMFGSVIISMLILLRFKLQPEKIISGFLTGLVVALLNMLIEYLGARLDIYYVSGPWTVLNTPLPLTIGWIFLSFIYCTGYSLMIKDKGGRRATRAYIVTGVIVGCLLDLFFYRHAGILTLGKRGTPYHVILIWPIFVVLALATYEFFMGVLERRR